MDEGSSNELDAADDISISSTIEFIDADEEWPVNRILAEGTIDDEKRYLIDWQGYKLADASWEPVDHLTDEIIEEWRQIKLREEKGDIPAFRIEDWRRATIEQLSAKYARHEARNRKRQILGVATTEYVRSLSDVIGDLDHYPTDDDDQNRNNDQPATTITTTTATTATTTTTTTTTAEKELPNVRVSDSGDFERVVRVKPKASEQNSLRAKYASTKATGTNSTTAAAASSANPRNLNPLNVSRTAVTSIKRHAKITNNVFAGGTTRKKRSTLHEAASDPTRAPKLLSARLTRKLELTSRDMEGTKAPTQAPKQLISLDSRRLSNPEIVEIDPSSNEGLGSPQSGHNSPGDAMIAPESPIFIEDEPDVMEFEPPFAEDELPLAEGERAAVVEDEPVVVEESKKTKATRRKRSVHWGDEITADPMETDERRNSDATPKNPQAPIRSILAAPKQSAAPIDVRQPKTDITIIAKIGPGISELLPLTLSDLPVNYESDTWLPFLRKQETVNLTRACSAIDYIQQVNAGSVVATNLAAGTVLTPADDKDINALSYNLSLGSLGLFGVFNLYCILIFPAKCEDWLPYIENAKIPATESCLCYAIFEPLEAFRSLASTLQHQTATKEAAELRTVSTFWHRESYSKLLPKQRDSSGSPTFFLLFPASQGASQEASILGQWLRAVDPDCKILTTLAAPGGWMQFLKHCHGTVIIHPDSLRAMYNIRSLSTLLWAKEEKCEIWELFIPPPPLALGATVHKLGASISVNESIHLRPSFPPGIAVLIPPSLFVTQPKQAYNLVKWFYKNFSNSAKSYRTGRLVVAYNIEEWMGELALQTPLYALSFEKKKKVSEIRMKTLALLRQMIQETYTNESLKCVVEAPMSVHGDDEESLVNWFGWWSLSQSHIIRQFCVLCSDSTDANRMSRLLRVPKMRPSAEPKEVTHKLRQNSITAPGSLETVIDVSNRLNIALAELDAATRGSQLSVYRIPVDQNGRDIPNTTYHNIPTWFNFCWNRFSTSIETSCRARIGRTNTYAAFFYTANNKDIGHGQEQADLIIPTRTPWLAFYRPQNPHQPPATSMELFIWDCSLGNKFSKGDAIDQNDLSEAQNELINIVKIRGAKLPLKNVWIGGFNVDYTSHAESIDATLTFLRAVTQNIRQYLPAPEATLPTRGWQSIYGGDGQPYTTAKRAQGRKDPSYDTLSNIVFEPPGALDTNPDACRNRLFRWARKPAVDKEKRFTFVPTMQWYSEQERLGRGYEHIVFDNWRKFLTFYQIDASDIE